MDQYNEDSNIKSKTIEQKRQKIRSNYDTITVLKDKLNEGKAKQRSGMTRASYVKMILDATGKVTNQNEELAKVIMETRTLQREIDSLSGRLERSFALVASIIPKGFRNEKWSKECHELLKLMHENCSQLIGAVEETGEVTREIRQLEDQIGRTKAS